MKRKTKLSTDDDQTPKLMMMAVSATYLQYNILEINEALKMHKQCTCKIHYKQFANYMFITCK